MLVAAADKHHVVPAQPQVAHIYVGRYVDAGQMAYMHRPLA